jgi:hypothetical protein
VDRAVDLLDSPHLTSLTDAGHTVVARAHSMASDLPSAPTVDIPALKSSIAHGAHQLAHSIDQGADTVAPPRRGRWRIPILLAGLALAVGLVVRRTVRQKTDTTPVPSPFAPAASEPDAPEPEPVQVPAKAAVPREKPAAAAGAAATNGSAKSKNGSRPAKATSDTAKP